MVEDLGFRIYGLGIRVEGLGATLRAAVCTTRDHPSRAVLRQACIDFSVSSACVRGGVQG
jgi:hypothetical protein